jgi:hypothetical protein
MKPWSMIVILRSPGAFSTRTLAHAAIPPRQSPMSMTGMINVGTGAVALGFSAVEHAFS